MSKRTNRKDFEIALIPSVKDWHCIETMRGLVNRLAINANDPHLPLAGSSDSCEAW